jgi:hypothetical protein
MAMYKFSFVNGRDHGEDSGASITFSLPTIGVRAKGEDPFKLASELIDGIHDKHVPLDFYADLLRIKTLIGQLCNEFAPKEELKSKSGDKAD